MKLLLFLFLLFASLTVSAKTFRKLEGNFNNYSDIDVSDLKMSLYWYCQHIGGAGCGSGWQEVELTEDKLMVPAFKYKNTYGRGGFLLHIYYKNEALDIVSDDWTDIREILKEMSFYSIKPQQLSITLRSGHDPKLFFKGLHRNALNYSLKISDPTSNFPKEPILGHDIFNADDKTPPVILLYPGVHGPNPERIVYMQLDGEASSSNVKYDIKVEQQISLDHNLPVEFSHFVIDDQDSNLAPSFWRIYE